MQVIKSVNLRDIHRKRIWKQSYPQLLLPLMSRHVESIKIRFPILLQPVNQLHTA